MHHNLISTNNISRGDNVLKRLRNVSVLLAAFLTFNIVMAFGGESPNKYIQSSGAKDVNQNIQSDKLLRAAAKETKSESKTLKPSKKKKTSKSTIIGSYQTKIIDKSKNRVRNIKLATRKINNYTIRPGEVFSFNEVVGKRTKKRGFKRAKIIVDGETDVGIGGGICQLSTTLYNAANRANLEVIERHSHSKRVHYVPIGRDAAVDYGHLDLKFKNTKNYSVKIKARVYKGKIIISLIKVKKR